jgi:hypothetical protein
MPSQPNSDHENQRKHARQMGDLRTTMSDKEIVDLMKADWERRMATSWGRFLLWLLRKTT